jgi:hypothetical protein
MVKEKLISDIELRLNGGIVSDDLRINRAQIGHWLDITRDRLVENELKTNTFVSSVYLTTPDESLTISEETRSDLENPRYYITLTKPPLSIPDDGAILKVLTSDLEPVHRTTIEELDSLKRLHFAKPSQNNLVYWTRGQRLYIEGATERIQEDYTVDVYYIYSYASNSPAETDEFKISEGLISVLLDLVEEIARREFASDRDLINDGN